MKPRPTSRLRSQRPQTSGFDDTSWKCPGGLLTIDISKIADMQGNTTDCCTLRASGYKHYLWNKDDGRANLGAWVEAAAQAIGK